MLHKISEFCNKIDTIKKCSDDLRVLKYQTPKSSDRDLQIQNLIDTIQADCLLVASDKSDYDNEKDKNGDYGDYSGVNHDGMLNDKKE